MTTEEFILKQRKIFQQVVEKDEPLRVAAQDTLAMQVTRIFIKGQNSQGSLIGHGAYNDTTPLYVNPKKSPGKGFKPAGKPFDFGTTRGGKIKTVRSTSRFVSGKSTPHVTRWFPSYKDYRKTIGRETSFVDLFLSGDLKSDFSNSGRTKESPAKISKANTHEYRVGLKREINIKKREGLESKSGYSNIFNLSVAERRNFFDIARKQFQLIIARA